jgi:hypothetical protein
MLEITEVAVKNGQSKDTGYIGQETGRRETKHTQKQNTEI